MNVEVKIPFCKEPRRSTFAAARNYSRERLCAVRETGSSCASPFRTWASLVGGAEDGALKQLTLVPLYCQMPFACFLQNGEARMGEEVGGTGWLLPHALQGRH